jgi:hypothetical protein
MHEPPFRGQSLRPLIAGAGAMLGCALFALPAHAQAKLTAHYALSLAGIAIGDGDWAVEISKDRYTAESTGRFYGVWRVILGGDIAASTRGTASQGHLAPASYAANFSWDDEIEDVKIAYRDGTVSDFETKPPIAATPDRIAVSAAHLRGAVDPLTAGLAPVPGTGDMLAPAACQHTQAIFDGSSHRFDMALSFKRKDNAKMEAGNQVPAIVCTMTYRPVAGYSPGAFRVNYLKANHDMEMWFAPIAGTRLLAVIRISIPTMLGTAVLKATQFESTPR